MEPPYKPTNVLHHHGAAKPGHGYFAWYLMGSVRYDGSGSGDNLRVIGIAGLSPSGPVGAVHRDIFPSLTRMAPQR